MFIKNVSPFTDERFETNLFFEQKFCSNFFRNYAESCRTLAMKVLPIDKVAFYLSRGIFGRISFSEKNISSWITFSRIRREIFSRDLGRKQALGRKASARLPKLESTLAKCFIKKTYFFWRDKCLGTFFQIVGGFFSDSCEKHQKIVKLIFYLSRATSPCDNFLLGNYRVW